MNKLKRFVCGIMAALILVSAPVTSYMEVQAAEVLGGLALAEILESLLVTSGVASVGYVTIREGQDMKVKQEAFERAILADGKVAAALEDAAEWENNYGNQALPGDYSYVSDSGFKVTNMTSGGTVNVALDPSLVIAAKNAARAWADSEENNYKTAADADKAGTEKVDSQYMSSITTTVKSLPSIDSMNDMDEMFGIDGACGYFRSQGYSDGSYYWLVYVGGSSTVFMPVPYGYSVVGARVAWLGSEYVRILSNANYKNAIVQNGVRDASSFGSYFSNLSFYTGKYYTYDHKSSSWDMTEGNYLPSIGSLSGRYSFSNWYTCGYKDAYSDGSLISYNYFTSALSRIIYTFDSVGKFFTYDYSKAPSIPDEGYVFSIPESDHAGFGDMDLAALVPYILSLSDTLKDLVEDQEKNQEEIIQQGKDTIEAINNMHITIGKISTAVGDLLSTVGKILTAVLAIGKDVAAIPDKLVNNFVDALPDVITAAVAAVFPRVGEAIDAIIAFPDTIAGAVAEAVADVAIDIPDIVVPEITIPDIVIPDIEVPAIDIPDIVIPEITIPDVITISKLDISDLSVPAMANPVIDLTLNPAYDITVANDFTGLDSVIAAAVQGVLEYCFVPDEALTMERFSTMQDYFRFTDDMKRIIGDFEREIWGITPSPYLKIPIGKPTSKKYNYGTGDFIIIDISWYAEYKSFGDKIILAVVWAVFLWKIYVLLPGIVSGSVGGFIMGADIKVTKELNDYYSDSNFHDQLNRYDSKDLNDFSKK